MSKRHNVTQQEQSSQPTKTKRDASTPLPVHGSMMFPEDRCMENVDSIKGSTSNRGGLDLNPRRKRGGAHS